MSGQVPVLVGVALGALLSFCATYVIERLHWRRSQSVRWDERRLMAYADYAHAVKQMVVIGNRICAGRGLASLAQPLEPSDENFALLASVEERRTVLAETLRLLSDAATDEAARAMTQCAWRIERMARGLGAASSEDWEQAIDEFQHARSIFTECARSSLQVDGSSPYGSYGRRTVLAQHVEAATEETPSL